MTILNDLAKKLETLKRAEPRSMMDCNITGRNDRFEMTHLGNSVKIRYIRNDNFTEQSFKFKDNFKAVSTKILDYFKISRDLEV